MDDIRLLDNITLKEARTMNNTITESYQAMKQRQQKEVNEFEGVFFAFNKEQLKEGFERVGLSVDNKDDFKLIYSIGAGGYILKTRSKAFLAMFERHKEEKLSLRKQEKSLLDALVYELRNHEYCITYTTEDALSALGYAKEDIEPSLLKKACKMALEV